MTMKLILSAIGTQIFIFGLIWWIVLFTVLPLGVKHAPRPETGHDPGAPIEHKMKQKALITTLISFFLWAIYFFCTKILGYSILDLPL